MQYDPIHVRDWIRGVLSGIYMPEPDEEIWQWAERTLRIPGTENEELAGHLWQSGLSPYVRELFEWFKQPGKGEFWIQKSSQVGFTMACLILICWMIVHRSGNIIYAIDSEKQAREVSKTRLKKWITLNGILDEVDANPDDLSNLTYFLKGLTVYMVGSHSPGSWATKSCVLIILDEVDKQAFIEGEGWTTDLARERVKRPKNSKIIGFSTPGESGQIGKEVSHGTCEEIRIPFPCCGHKQALKWDALQFSGKEFRDLAGDYDMAKVESDAYFKCELCGGELRNDDKYAALLKYEFVPTKKNTDPRVRSALIWDAYSNFVTFGQLAVGWIKAQGDPTKIEAFMRGRRGEYFVNSGGQISESELLDLRGAYRRGACPPVDVILYAMTVDIQNKELFKATKAVFTPEGDMYVIDWRELVSYEEVLSFANEPLETIHGPMIVICGMLDEGNDKDDVRSFCLENYPRFYPVKGRGGDQVQALITESPQNHMGYAIVTYHVDDRSFKWQLLYRLRRMTFSEKKREEIRKLTLPINVNEDENFLAELTNEFPTREKNKFGVEQERWRVRGSNDWWDTLKYMLSIWNIMKADLIAARAKEDAVKALAKPTELAGV